MKHTMARIFSLLAVMALVIATISTAHADPPPYGPYGYPNPAGYVYGSPSLPYQSNYPPPFPYQNGTQPGFGNRPNYGSNYGWNNNGWRPGSSYGWQNNNWQRPGSNYGWNNNGYRPVNYCPPGGIRPGTWSNNWRPNPGTIYTGTPPYLGTNNGYRQQRR